MEATPGLSRRERQIMDALYHRGEATVAEVMEEIPDPPSYSAVRATLRILEEKGHVLHKQDGPRYVYVPSVPAEDARTTAMKHLVRTFFDGSTELAAAALLRLGDTKVSDADIERLAGMIRKAAEEGR
ncbi:MAG TPA: BlaI/MecI/CopY family transcriptional regulator [Longimicrobiales bacterium]|nr:BlaI/MecI/CopY family transcriptional regulator [Longimicrobiales bacterium]